jgi:bis(5'-nucleosyl)-tetraphosphatase (symmetrical)
MARTIFVGDLQGCLDPLERLLERLAFDPARDRLCFAGDLVNRGGQSLACLRRVRALGEAAVSVLGNHDLHLLAYAFGARRKPNREFDEILEAPDSAALLEWLRARPLMWRDDERRLAMVHAGIDPRWGPEDAWRHAGEIERALAEAPEAFFEHMYGDRPERWEPGLPEPERLRTLTNVFTRMRFCDAAGRLELSASGGPDTAPAGYRPWFEFLPQSWRAWRLVFGHWSQLGLHEHGPAICLDSGCVWGGRLSALVVADGEESIVSVDCSGC